MSEVDRRIGSFLRRLHALKLAKGRCFVSGAFVLQIPPASARFQAFLADLMRHSSRRVGARTHNDFQRADTLARRRLCGPSCAPLGVVRAGAQREYRFRVPLVGLCGDDGVKRVMLFYTFGVGTARYMYIKLESHPALSAAHAAAAVSRYVLKKSKASAFAPRRENAYKDRGGVTARAAFALARADAEALWPSLAREARAYNASLRIGNEMFVPAAAALELLPSPR